MARLSPLGLALLLSIAAGCSNNPSNPLAPGGTAPPDGTAAGPGGTTLKVGTPAAHSPAGRGTLDTLTPTLRIEQHARHLPDDVAVVPRSSSTRSTTCCAR